MKRAVLITGATGFVGSALARELASRGDAVHALARSTSDRAMLDGVPVTWHEGDLRERDSVERAVSSVASVSAPPAWVIHSGAVISYHSRDSALQRAVNVEGTRHVVDACRRAPIGRLVHVSSVVAVGFARGSEVLDEGALFNGRGLGCDYMETKREAEELALGAAEEIDVVAVNPGAIFGVGARSPNTVKFLRKLARGRVGPFAPPGALSVVGLGDVVAGTLLALERGRRGRRYLLTESAWEPRELFRFAAAMLRARSPRWTVPAWLWGTVVAGARGIDLVAPQELFTPQSLRMLGLAFRFDSARARTELGWRPRAFAEVLAETIRDLCERGELEVPPVP